MHAIGVLKKCHKVVMHASELALDKPLKRQSVASRKAGKRQAVVARSFGDITNMASYVGVK